MANEPTQYPAATSQRGGFLRALRGPGTVRQPDLGSAPNIAATAGLGGTGAGAFFRAQGSENDRSQGLAVIICGLSPQGSGSITLNFPAGVAANQYVFFADWASLAPQAPSGNQITVNWTANRPLLPNERLLLAYQWATSQ
jgi:hypothetical protein